MLFNWGQRDHQPANIPLKDLERALSKFCTPGPPDSRAGSKSCLSNENFDHIAGLLKHLEAHKDFEGWSTRPRTYTVLRNIGRLDTMQRFIDLHLKDISFPYSMESISQALVDNTAQSDFLSFQHHVLTRAMEIERGLEGQHVHFGKNGDRHFNVIKHLGTGGFGYVRALFYYKHCPTCD